MPFLHRFPQRWVLPLAIFALLLLLLVLELPIIAYTKGALVYPMDDAFIHMSIAKNLALHGVWGVSKYEFVSASSSILYPPVLAIVFLITGPNVIVPLLINLAAGIALLIVIQRWLRAQALIPLHQLLILLVAIILIPLPYIIRLGMEHTLQILFCFLFISKFIAWLTESVQRDSPEWVMPWQIFVYGMLVTAIRYEGVFLIFIACLYLLYYRKIALALELGVFSIIPVLLFGFYSIYMGNYFLPSPVLLKSTPLPSTPSALLHFIFKGVFEKIYYFDTDTSTVAVQRILFLLPVICILFWKFLKTALYYRLILTFLISATFLHLVFANTNWFYRYEAYLLTSSIICIGVLFAKFGKQLIPSMKPFRCVAVLLFTIIILYPFLLRSKEAFAIAKPACLNLYDQDYHVGQFLHKYYDTTKVGFNDLGCITYYTSAKSLDLVGLGNIEVAKSRRNNYYNESFLDTIIKLEHIKLIVIFDRLLPRSLLHKWKKVATWHFDHQIIPGDENYSFYAVDTLLAPGLKQNLMSYQKFLPPGVTLRY